MRPSSLHDTSFDARAMRYALNMGARGLGRTWPNPSVGCVIAKNSRILAAAHTADGGRLHAETTALQQAGEAANNPTVYMTLEPCAHTGQTPPRAKALIDRSLIQRRRCSIKASSLLLRGSEASLEALND